MPPGATARTTRGRSAGARAIGLAGEVLVTAAVLIALFLTWKLWWMDGLAASQQTAAAHRRLSALPVVDRATPDDPVVSAEPETGEVIGVLRVPRFGPDYARTIAHGTASAQLSTFDLGIGHYEGTAMPGAIGNFAIAGHRSAYGGAMHLLDRLRPGDPIVVETRAGRYEYAFRGIRVVQPDAVEVLEPTPGRPGVEPTRRLITLTTCTPLYSTAQRLVAVGELTAFDERRA